jgi:hypothetical protein
MRTFGLLALAALVVAVACQSSGLAQTQPATRRPTEHGAASFLR